MIYLIQKYKSLKYKYTIEKYPVLNTKGNNVRDSEHTTSDIGMSLLIDNGISYSLFIVTFT